MRFTLSTDSESRAAIPDKIRLLALKALENWQRLSYVMELPRGRTWDLSGNVALLGILNVTPDSFSDGDKYLQPSKAVQHAMDLLEDGADAIDLGGESTRPGAEAVGQDEEIRRIAPVLAAIRKKTDCPISIDTSKAEVARVSLEEGADIINDVTALEGDADMVPLLRERPVPVVLMHMLGNPRIMQENPCYSEATAEILKYLHARLRDLELRGIAPERTFIDPGIGFGKRSSDNLDLVKNINEFRSLGRPSLVGLSRKSFLGKLLGKSVEDREAGTLVANTLSALNGVRVIRVHNISNAREMKKILATIHGIQ